MNKRQQIQEMEKNQQNEDYGNRPMTKDSTATTFRRSHRSNRQYFSLKKNKSALSETSYTTKSPTRNNQIRIKKASLSPDRKNMYWQNWLLPQQFRKPNLFQKPLLASSSVCAIYADNNQVFLAENCHQPRQVASLTKIMTAFTVIQICNSYGVKIRQTWVPIQKQASMMEGTSANLRTGEEILVIDLLFGLMLPSGNDAAIALAMYFGKFLSYIYAHEHLYDGDEQSGSNISKFIAQRDFYDLQYNEESLQLFVFEMNKNCQKIGLKKTNFTNPTGLSDVKSYSTSYDIALLVSFCMRNHLLRTIFKKKVYICESKNEKMASKRTIQWKNTNKHLFLFRDCIGVKTGITPGAGPCLSSAYRVFGRQLIVIVLNSPSLQERYVDSQKVFKHAKSKLQSELQNQQINLSPGKNSSNYSSFSPCKIQLPTCK